MEYPQELLELFQDELLADVRPKARPVTIDDRLAEQYRTVVSFYQENGRLPGGDGDFSEKLLARTWNALKAKHADAVRQIDELNLLEL